MKPNHLTRRADEQLDLFLTAQPRAPATSKYSPPPQDDPWHIPDFLRLTAEERAAAWRGKKLTNGQGDTSGAEQLRWDIPRTIDATGLALLRQVEKERAARRVARFVKLKERS